MKDIISLILIMLIAVTVESSAVVWLPMLVAVALLQIDKIEKIIKQ